MQNFLIEFSTVPKKFLDDFFNIIKEDYDDNEIIIDFDIVCEWLEVRKDNLFRLLENNFDIEFDYIINKIRKKHDDSDKSSNYNEILITPNCFKELCMISQTKKAKEVRKYFLEIEKLMKKYMKTIKDNLYEKIGLLEKNQKPKIDIKSGVIYILKALNNDTTLYKLGKSNDIKQRLANYNSGNANNIEPIFIMKVKDIDSVESCIKNICKKHQYRKYKEVYEIDIEVLKTVIKDCDIFVDSMAKKLQDKIAQKKFNKNISRMKKKLDKYFFYIDK